MSKTSKQIIDELKSATPIERVELLKLSAGGFEFKKPSEVVHETELDSIIEGTLILDPAEVPEILDFIGQTEGVKPPVNDPRATAPIKKELTQVELKAQADALEVKALANFFNM